MAFPDSVSPDCSAVNNTSTNSHLPEGWLKYAAPLVLLFLALGLIYRDGILWLLEVWSHNDYSHGYLVPLVSLYLVWEQRERYRRLTFTPAYPAAAFIILAALALLLVSRSSAFIQLEGASLFLIIPGILLLLFGRHVTRAALLPWLYLSFMLPWFDLFLDRVQPPFQRFTAILATKLLSLIYPVFLTDIQIQLPGVTMEVAKECSGVAFFISVLAIGVPLVYLTQRSWRRALLVLLFGVIITILANGLRVAMAGVMGETFGPSLLHGPAHILQGWFVAWVGWVGLFLVNWLLLRKSAPGTPRLFERWTLLPQAAPGPGAPPFLSLTKLYQTLAVVSVGLVVVAVASPRPAILSAPLSSLPLKLDSWSGDTAEWLEQKTIFPGEEWRNREVLFPGADEQLSRVYRSSQNAEPIYLYIAYFNKQTEQQRLISGFSRPLHKNADSILFQDWEPGSIPSGVARTTLTQNGISYTIFFWYQFPDGTTVTKRNEARLLALKNGLLHQHNNGAAILLAVRQQAGQPVTSPHLPQPISAFLQTAGPAINQLMP